MADLIGMNDKARAARRLEELGVNSVGAMAFFDGVVAELISRKGIGDPGLKSRHADLE
jgi:hypothetical protein